MSLSFQENGAGDAQVVAGEKLVLRVRAYDPAGISRIYVQCFQFSMAASNRMKLAVGEAIIAPEDGVSRDAFEVPVQIPDNASIGKWGVQMVEFTNGRGYKTSFYRGQGKFDTIVFEVVSPPSKEDELLCFNGVEIAKKDRCA
ncbi:MAG TPA: hypothetical protein VFO63_05010 [Blastocatellia bacterium]|nr:hypothetical protein [Blastocatellia bacterium]